MRSKNLDARGQAGPLGWTIPAALGVVAADRTKKVRRVSGDYGFRFLVEELAVGAQFHLPYVHVLVNNRFLGLVRQSQRNVEMDFCVQLALESQNVPEDEGSLRDDGVDRCKVVEGFGCRALPVTEPDQLEGALRRAQD